jgi:hypothetical protein
VKGTALLDNAKQTVNPFYTVKGQHQEDWKNPTFALDDRFRQAFDI